MTNIIAVVGKSGSGKTTFCKLLKKNLNCKHINIDEVAHSIYKNPEFIDFICEYFGSDYIDDNGQVVDRKIIGEYVFSHKDSKQVKLFNELSWQLMKEQIDNQISTEYDYVILDWFNLQNTPYFDDSKVKILIKPKDEEQRLLMIRLRDNISKEYLEKRENNGVIYNECDFDYVIEIEYDNVDIIDKAQKMANAIVDICTKKNLNCKKVFNK